MFNYFSLFTFIGCNFRCRWKFAPQFATHIKYGILCKTKFDIVSSQGLSLPGFICVKSISFDKFLFKDIWEHSVLALRHEY